MIANSDIIAAIEAAGCKGVLVVNATELETCIHREMPDDGRDLVVDFVDTNGSFRTDPNTGRVFETRRMLLIFYSRNDFEASRDAITEGGSHDGQVTAHKDSAAAVIAALNWSGLFAMVTSWEYSVHPFETTDVANGMWVTFELTDTVGTCA